MKFSSEAQHRKMIETPVPRLIVSLALPAIASQLITTIYNTADTYFVSQIGTSASAAVGVVFALMSLIQSLGFGIGMGTSSLISRRLGAGKNEDANKFGSSAIAAAFTLGCLIMIFGLIFLHPLMRILGSTETILPYSAAYARIILLGAPLLCPCFVLNNILRSEGEAFFAMWGLCTGGILNIFLDPLFIFTFRLGIAGAALATILSQAVSFLILLSMFLRGKSIVQLHFRSVSRKMSDYLLIVTTGAPTFCRQGLASLASAVINLCAAPYGDAAIAAVTIANKIYLLVRNIILGIGHGFQPVAGYNYGAGIFRRVRQAFNFATELGTVLNIAAAVLLALFAAPVIGWFRNDPDVIRIGVQTLYFACAVMPMMAYSTYVNQIYQVLGFRVPATFLACCRQGVMFLPLAAVLPRVLGLTGVEMLQPGADFLTFLSPCRSRFTCTARTLRARGRAAGPLLRRRTAAAASEIRKGIFHEPTCVPQSDPRPRKAARRRTCFHLHPRHLRICGGPRTGHPRGGLAAAGCHRVAGGFPRRGRQPGRSRGNAPLRRAGRRGRRDSFHAPRRSGGRRKEYPAGRPCRRGPRLLQNRSRRHGGL